MSLKICPIRFSAIKSLENSPTSSALQSPRVPKSVQYAISKRKVLVALVPSLVFSKKLRIAAPRMNKKFYSAFEEVKKHRDFMKNFEPLDDSYIKLKNL